MKINMKTILNTALVVGAIVTMTQYKFTVVKAVANADSTDNSGLNYLADCSQDIPETVEYRLPGAGRAFHQFELHKAVIDKNGYCLARYDFEGEIDGEIEEHSVAHWYDYIDGQTNLRKSSGVDQIFSSKALALDIPSSGIIGDLGTNDMNRKNSVFGTTCPEEC